MADTPDADQKTEPPSDKRRREAATRGEVLQSRELGTALVIMAACGWLLTGAPALVAACGALLRHGLAVAPDADPAARLLALVRPLAAPMLGFAAITLAGLLAGPLLTSARFSLAAAAPKFSRINPAAGFKRMFGLQAPVELLKAGFKAAILLGVGWVWLRARLPALFGASASNPGPAAAQIGAAVGQLFIALTLALVLIAAVDLPIQLQRHLARLRMTKQEVRDEAKDSEGSPETRARLRRAQRSAARGALRAAMADASVVIVNPAHFAVALRYDPLRDAAPVVMAKGRDIIAAAIRDLAAEAKVPVLSYPQLTRAVYFTAAVGQSIRDELYVAVAAVLAFVFSLDRAAAAAAQPELEVPETLRFDAQGRVETQPQVRSGPHT